MPPSHVGASMRAPRPALARLTTVALAAAFAVSGFAGTTSEASAATTGTASSTQTQHMTTAQRAHRQADRVMTVTRNQHGDPYQYGAAGPNRFDCSGLVMYVFQHALGRSLPHSADMQLHRSHRIWHRSHLRRGDLVFQVDGSGYAYHVGIYAGNGYMWDAPHSGARVHKHKMYHAHWRYGRLIQR